MKDHQVRMENASSNNGGFGVLSGSSFRQEDATQLKSIKIQPGILRSGGDWSTIMAFVFTRVSAPQWPKSPVGQPPTRFLRHSQSSWLQTPSIEPSVSARRGGSNWGSKKDTISSSSRQKRLGVGRASAHVDPPEGGTACTTHDTPPSLLCLYRVKVQRDLIGKLSSQLMSTWWIPWQIGLVYISQPPETRLSVPAAIKLGIFLLDVGV
ncbi:hypothetical protein JTE90_006739 [Oedothorax gibbosus]|uniref:Uncharacterized protein n=1 Tax=Oedothorax gibbosus TaxID=931172 RepID=A0AAV6UA03_9ARAC|nr:hypothetical protein JTE90_006739 [Oedothorax gibbosus]